MRRNSRNGPPAILAFLLAAALVFGVYYIWQGVQTYLRTGGLGVVESTQRAQQVANEGRLAGAERAVERDEGGGPQRGQCGQALGEGGAGRLVGPGEGAGF